MSKRTRRKLNSLRRASGAVLESDVNQFGQRVLFYDGLPIVVDDFAAEGAPHAKGVSADIGNYDPDGGPPVVKISDVRAAS